MLLSYGLSISWFHFRRNTNAGWLAGFENILQMGCSADVEHLYLPLPHKLAQHWNGVLANQHNFHQLNLWTKESKEWTKLEKMVINEAGDHWGNQQELLTRFWKKNLHLDALHMAAETWTKVNERYIKNSFQKAVSTLQDVTNRWNCQWSYRDLDITSLWWIDQPSYNRQEHYDDGAGGQ